MKKTLATLLVAGAWQQRACLPLPPSRLAADNSGQGSVVAVELVAGLHPKK